MIFGFVNFCVNVCVNFRMNVCIVFYALCVLYELAFLSSASTSVLPAAMAIARDARMSQRRACG